MTDRRSSRLLRLSLCAASALVAVPALAEPTPAPAGDLASQFRDPPASARPRVWWHWMNGNITKDGIAKDMAWMKAVGIGGLQNFDVNLRTPQIVEHRLAYMTPEWKDAFRFAAHEADRLGLELAIAASPGWSETGGPWVKPEDGLKKVVWSETHIPAGKRFTGTIATPPTITGPFQSLPKQPGLDEAAAGGLPMQTPALYRDIAVFAVPDSVAADLLPTYTTDSGTALDAAKLVDADLVSAVAVSKRKDGPASVVMAYPAPQTIRSARMFLAHASIMFGGAIVDPVLEASDDGAVWRHVADLPAADVPTTVSFAPVTARQFRLVLKPRAMAPSNMGEPAPGVAMPDLFGAALGGAEAPWDLRLLTLSTSPAIDRFESKAGFAIALDYFALPRRDDGATGPLPGQVIDVTRFLRPDGTLDWQAPALPKGATWRIVRLGASLLGTTNHPAPAEATGLEVDKFDGDAVGRYLDHYLGMYRDAAGPDLIGAHGVRALLTDSIEVGAANWTPRMIEQFRRLRGYDPTPWLPTLTGVLIGSRADADRFLFDWRRTLADLMASEHYGTVARKAHEAGLKVYGEALEDKRPSLGDDMAMRTHTDVPMSAMWTFSQKAGPNPSYIADIKGAASVAHIYGQNLVAAESMTSALQPWASSPRTLKHIMDLELVTGVNRPVVHTSVHQPVDDKIPGLSLMIFGQYFNRHEAWAPLAKAWVDYISRNALLLQKGHDAADLGYFYGEEAPLTGLYGLKPVADAPRTHGYDFVNAQALTGALANDGADLVSAGGARYRALYLGGSSAHMSLPTLQRLAALVEGGATVIGTAPEDDPGLASADAAIWHSLVAKLWPAGSTQATFGRGRVIASHDVEAALATLGITPDFRMTGGAADADVPFLHRRWQGGDSWFLVNRKERSENFEAHFRVTGKVPELWHPETGQIEAVSYRSEGGETIVPLTLAGEDAVHVVFTRPATTASASIAPVPHRALASLDDNWTVRFEAGRGAPAEASLPRLAPLDRNADPAIRYFSGVATYARDVVAPRDWKAGQPLWLDLGEVREMAQVLVNGQDVGTVWHAPYRVDLGHAFHAGRNHVEVRVANLWVNRLIGDAQPGATKVTFTALPTYRADAPLQPSGLIGPVKLETASR